jgi:DNA-directed RNA polymerase specialized sigma24 family protein
MAGGMEYEDLPDEELVRLTLNRDEAARNALLERHYEALRRQALRVCFDPNDADDLVHDAVLKSLEDLHNLRKADRFFVRARQFILDGVKKLRKAKARNVGPDGDSLLPTEFEGMRVDPPPMTEADRVHLRALLERAASHLRKACAFVIQIMLRHFDEHGKFPSAQTIEDEAGTSHGNAQRCREEILEVWQRICKDSEFYTPKEKKPEK